MYEAMLYIGVMMVAICTLFVVGGVTVAVIKPAPQARIGKHRSYAYRVWLAFKEL